MLVRHVEVPGLSIALLFLDVLCVAAACALVLDYTNFSPHAAPTFAVDVLIVFGSVLTSIFSMGLYQRAYLSPRKLLIRIVLAFVLSFALADVLLAITPSSSLTPYVVLIAHLAAFSGLVGNRMLARQLGELRAFRRRVFVFGSEAAARTVAEVERTRRPARFLCVTDPGWPAAHGERTNLAAAALAANAKEIVLPDMPLSARLAEELLECRVRGLRISSLDAFLERETRRINVGGQEAIRLILTQGAHRGLASRTVKRALDIFGSLVLLTFTLPVTAIAALAIFLEGDGPIFYRQVRVGMQERPFLILKFRTMVVEAEADKVEKWATASDPRVTRVGRALRACRIDEIPQLVNILLGDMSLVGPRPERPAIVARLKNEIPFYSSRHLVLPGLTGWAQINWPYGASLEDAVQKTQLDFYYIKNGSVILDLLILLQTVRVVLLAEGSR